MQDDLEKQFEGNVLLTVRDNRFAKPLFIDVELITLLWNEPHLVGFYIHLYYLQQLGLLSIAPDKKVAEVMGISYMSFLKYRDSLKKIGLINVTKNGTKCIVDLNQIDRLSKDDLKPPTNLDDFPNWMIKLQKKIQIITPEYAMKIQAIEKAKEEKIQQELLAREAVKKAKEKEKAKAKREEKRFPNEDYEIVLNAYKKYKGVGLLGPEINRAKRAIKQMFLAERRIKDIVDCMKFFHDNQRNEEYKWLQSWTIETVMKKIPEFVAGQLKSRTMEDDYKKY